ncbi:M20 metallopeptidase family protein [Lacticigenium naphthae]|uniref:M20 metallopeptidase family protein n=1 Tax=Lacticigenium naphthae TaxID=515351 RepID=UPI0004034FDE|nr:amidohydrolase [Lacticigenium naphthae]
MKKSNYEKAVALRHELHQHPELSNEETWTKQRLMDFIREQTTLEIVDKGNWFYAVYRAGTDRLNSAFRTEFDALPMDEVIELPWASEIPGKAHKCGHDGHAATMVGFALEVDQEGAANNTFFLFQPAEETGDGAIQCVDLIKSEQIDEIYGYHNFSGLAYQAIAAREGTTHFASKGMTIHFEGAPAHASRPEDGQNPSLAIAKLIQALPGFTHVKEYSGEVLATVIQIAVGSEAFGISPGEGELKATIRAYDEKDLDRLQTNVETFAKEIAKQEQLQVWFTYQDEFPETLNHKENVEKVRRAAKSLGYEYTDLLKAYRGSEDFGHYTKQTKGAFFYIGNGEEYPQVHTSAYDYRDENISRGVEMFKTLANMSD